MTDKPRIGLPARRPGDGTLADQVPVFERANVYAVSGRIPVTRSVIDDLTFNPPAPQNPFPFIDPVPWYTAAARVAREARTRITEAAWILVHGLEDDDR